jgi:hypothetical protein
MTLRPKRKENDHHPGLPWNQLISARARSRSKEQMIGGRRSGGQDVRYPLHFPSAGIVLFTSAHALCRILQRKPTMLVLTAEFIDCGPPANNFLHDSSPAEAERRGISWEQRQGAAQSSAGQADRALPISRLAARSIVCVYP